MNQNMDVHKAGVDRMASRQRPETMEIRKAGGGDEGTKVFISQANENIFRRTSRGNRSASASVRNCEMDCRSVEVTACRKKFMMSGRDFVLGGARPADTKDILTARGVVTCGVSVGRRNKASTSNQLTTRYNTISSWNWKGRFRVRRASSDSDSEERFDLAMR
ncbi:hypothetical protein PM082_016355 [Marasmius tenuissimus]|nr:hypothetical protein PM082_016355 [Marasmius tenuissimus]